MCGRYYVDNEEENIKVRAILSEIVKRSLPMHEQVHTGEIFPSQIAPVIVREPGLGRDRAPDEMGLSAHGRRGTGHQQPQREGRRYPDVPEGRAGTPLPGARKPFLRVAARTPGEKPRINSPSGRDTDEPLMYMAGVYGEFLGGFAGGGYDGFAILTREADSQMAPYHDRMPVILTDENLKKAWLNHDIAYAQLRPAFEPPKLRIWEQAPDQQVPA